MIISINGLKCIIFASDCITFSIVQWIFLNLRFTWKLIAAEKICLTDNKFWDKIMKTECTCILYLFDVLSVYSTSKILNIISFFL